MKNKFFILFILIFVFSSSFVFATNSFDLTEEKELYIDNANFYKTFTTKSSYVNDLYLEENFINSLFEYIENSINNSTYDFTDYPAIGIGFSNDNRIYVCLYKENDTTQVIYEFKDHSSTGVYYLILNINTSNGTITLNKDWTFKKGTSGTYFSTFTQSDNSVSSVTGFYLFNNRNFNYNAINSRLYFNYGSYNEFTPSSTDITIAHNLSGDTSYLLNKEFIIGKNYNTSIEYYYIENGEKIYLTNNEISTWANDINYGTLYDPYVTSDNIGKLKDKTDYYMDVKITSRLYNTSFSRDVVLNQKILTTNHTVNNDTESDDTGGGTITPSGDIPGDTPGITTPNYNEKLDNIQTGITNIENKIPTSGDIIQAGVNANKDYWGTSVDVSSGDFEDDVSGMITDIMDTASGELTDNEVFDALNKAEIGFINAISGQADDFKISWNDVIYMNTKLIPAGEVNFSKMARENETLGKVKEYLNIIASAMLGLSLIKYIYNLILATLGIDNPYLYDGNSQEKEATETVTYTTNFKTGKTIETKTRKEGNTRFVNRREI